MPDGGWLASLLGEGDRIGALLGPAGWLRVALVLGVVVLGGLALSRVLGLALGRTGERRRLAVVGLVANALLLVWGVAYLFRFFFRNAPTVTLAGGIVFFAALAFAMARLVPGALTVLAMSVSGRLARGDRVALPGVEGVVESVGLLRLAIRTQEGAKAWVSTRVLTEDVVSVSPPGAATLAEVELAVPDADPDRLAALRRLAALCPYRDVTQPVAVEAAPGLPTRVTVGVHAWSAEAADRAADWLRRRAGG